jgi:hypothetical protein
MMQLFKLRRQYYGLGLKHLLKHFENNIKIDKINVCQTNSIKSIPNYYYVEMLIAASFIPSLLTDISYNL